MTIGEVIKLLRKRKGITQEELATKSNISKNSIWNYENNKRIPTLKILSQIAKGLDEPLTSLTSKGEFFTVDNKICHEINTKITHNYVTDTLNTNNYMKNFLAFQEILNYIKLNSKYESLNFLECNLNDEKLLFEKAINYLEQELVIILINKDNLVK